MKEVYRMTKDELAKQYGMKGLTEEQAAKNLETYGRNELMDKGKNFSEPVCGPACYYFDYSFCYINDIG